MTTPRIIPQIQIEPRTIKHEFDVTLQGSVHDGLWMLTQQYRTGEFNGEDAASPIFSKIEVQESTINKFKSSAAGASPEVYNHEVPLEAKVEKMPLLVDWSIRIQMGNKFTKILRKVYTNPTDAQTHISQTISSFPLRFDVFDPNLKFPNKEEAALVKSAIKRIPDGYRMYLYMKDHTVLGGPFTGLTTNYTIIRNEFIQWFEKLYYQPGATSNQSNWSNEALEYKFSCSTPLTDASPSADLVLTNNQYSGGKLDWHSVDIDETVTQSGNNQSVFPTPVKTESLSFIPTSLKFKGMPVERWWQFEDKGSDFGALKDDYSPFKTANLSKLSIVNFGINYSNDWFMLPLKMKRGRLYEIMSLKVRNVIDPIEISVNNASTGNWGMYNLKTNGTTFVNKKVFIPPTFSQTQESEPIEKVIFLRDEVANLVWGVENRIPNNVGGSLDGLAAQNYIQNKFYEDLMATNSGLISSVTTSPDAAIDYGVMNTVPENWIPFIPTPPPPGTGRSITFNRGTFNRIIKEKFLLDSLSPYKFVRPNTSILKVGLPTVGYRINEEEILRSGIVVSTHFQRTRWYNGKIVNWLSRKKTNGLGEAESNLKFDFIKDVK